MSFLKRILLRFIFSVIPVKTGIQVCLCENREPVENIWIPASAGMTSCRLLLAIFQSDE
jgi:hypothetical protein